MAKAADDQLKPSDPMILRTALSGMLADSLPRQITGVEIVDQDGQLNPAGGGGKWTGIIRRKGTGERVTRVLPG